MTQPSTTPARPTRLSKTAVIRVVRSVSAQQAVEVGVNALDGIEVVMTWLDTTVARSGALVDALTAQGWAVEYVPGSRVRPESRLMVSVPAV